MAVSPFFRVSGFTVEPDADNRIQSKRRLAASRDVLLSGEAQWNLKLSNIIRNGVLYPWRYVTTVYAIKLGHNIILATRTLHSFIPLLCLCFTLFTVNPMFSLLYYVRADCVPDPLVRKPLDLP